MKELLYKKSEAVAALNRVDGFHPMELARKIGEDVYKRQGIHRANTTAKQ